MRAVLLLALAVLLVAFPAWAGPTPSAVRVDPSVDRYSLDGHLVLLEDTSARATIDDVQAEPLASQFTPLDGEYPTKGALTLLAPTLGEHITVERELPEEPAMAMGMPAKLNHALLELMQRSVERLSDGGTLRVEVDADVNDEADDDSDALTIRIHDDGPPIPEDRLARIFELGFDERDGRVRMSLGLPLAKRAIEESGGSLALESAEGGTTATITLTR